MASIKTLPSILSALTLLALQAASHPAHAADSCESLLSFQFTGFKTPEDLRAFRLKGVTRPYLEVLALNNIEFVSEVAIHNNPENGFTVYARYQGTDISFPVTKDRYFGAKAQQSIEGAIRAIEMTQNSSLIPSNATAKTRFRDSKVLKKLPRGVRRWLDSERERLSRDVDTKLTKGFNPTRNFQEPSFRPEEAKVFELEGYWLPAAKLNMLKGAKSESGLESRFERTRNGERQILFIVHPESRAYYAELLKESRGQEIFLGTSTASSRSLLVWQEGAESAPFIAKLSLDRQIGNIVRLIDKAEITKSMEVDQVIARASDEFPSDIVFVREVAGIIPAGQTTGGMIIRELSREIIDGRNTSVPFFALYGTSRPKQIPLILEAARKMKQPLIHVVTKDVIQPLARQWVLMARHGLLMEPHGQNGMIEVDAHNVFTGRFRYRDNGGYSFDFRLRKQLGLFVPATAQKLSAAELADAAIDHAKHHAVSLEKFLEGGFLSQLQSKSTEWEKSGLIPKALPPGFVHETLLSQLENEIFAQTGHKVHLLRDYSNLNDVMTKVIYEPQR